MTSMMGEKTVGSGPPSIRSFKLDYLQSGTPYITLQTASPIPVYLTPYYPTDVSTLQSTLSIESLAARLLSVPQPYTLASAQFWIDLQLTGKYHLPLQVLRANHPATGPLIGTCSLLPLNPEVVNVMKDKMPWLEGGEKKYETEKNEYELGYFLHPEWTGNGIMTAAVGSLLAWARHEHGAVPVVRIHEENLQSRKVIERFKEFVRVEERDKVENWPESKGGGKKKLLVWKWRDQ